MPRFDLESYVQVKERIKKFRADHPEWALRSEIVSLDDKRVVVHGWVMDEVDRILADGHAEEIRGSSNVNTTSPLENCETSAWGRALANLGYEVDKSIASREEMEKVERHEETRTKAPARKAAKAAKGIGAPSPPAADEQLQKEKLQQLRDELWSRVEGLSGPEQNQLKGWIVGLEWTTDFDAHTAEQVAAINKHIDEHFESPF